MEQIQFFQLLHQQEEVMVVQEHLLLDLLQMVDREDQVVVVLGIYQEQEVIVQVEQETHLQQLLLKVIMDQEDNTMDQLTLYQAVEAVQEVPHQHLDQVVEDQQVMELQMEEMEQQVQ
jgi:hypothetical protein